MVCIHCGAKTQIFNSRAQRRTNQVWRRRACTACGAAFTTIETPDYGHNWLVEASNGTLTPFLRDKLFLSLLEACKHRKTAITDAAGLCDTIMAKIAPKVVNGHLGSAIITQTAQVALNRFDMTASTAYGALHR